MIVRRGVLAAFDVNRALQQRLLGRSCVSKLEVLSFCVARENGNCEHTNMQQRAVCRVGLNLNIILGVFLLSILRGLLVSDCTTEQHTNEKSTHLTTKESEGLLQASRIRYGQTGTGERTLATAA